MDKSLISTVGRPFRRAGGWGRHWPRAAVTVFLLCLSFTAAGLADGIALEKHSLFGGRVEILLPVDFTVMPEAVVKMKYPADYRPNLVYTNSEYSVNVAFSLPDSSLAQSEIDEYKDFLVEMFKSAYPTAVWLSQGIELLNGRKFGYMELHTQAVDTDIYNLMFFTDMNGKVLLCSFNCTNELFEAWQITALQIMLSLKIKD